jgi:hypothetical protein
VALLAAPKNLNAIQTIYVGLGRDGGSRSPNVGWGPHVWGGGSGRDPALDWKPHNSNTRVWRLFHALSHRVITPAPPSTFPYDYWIGRCIDGDIPSFARPTKEYCIAIEGKLFISAHPPSGSYGATNAPFAKLEMLTAERP